ncbi:MAG: hypothetical protein ACRDPE_06285 [Solirubrobacterales bacterium]
MRSRKGCQTATVDNVVPTAAGIQTAEARAKLRFTAVGAEGQRDVVRKKVRLRAGRR